MKTLKNILLLALTCPTFFLVAEDLALTADRTIDVGAGETVDYDALTGGEFTLTKTGAGTLRLKAIANPDATIVIAGANRVRPDCHSKLPQ